MQGTAKVGPLFTPTRELVVGMVSVCRSFGGSALLFPRSAPVGVVEPSMIDGGVG